MLEDRKRASINGTLARATALFALGRGLDIGQMEAATDVSSDILLNPRVGVSDEFMHKLIRPLERLQGGKNMALPFAQRVPLKAIGEHWSILRRAPTLGAMSRLSQRGQAIISRQVQMILSSDPLAVELRHPLDLLDNGIGGEVAVGLTARSAWEHFGDDVIALAEFRHAPRGPTDAYEAFFRAPVRFERDANRLTYRPGADEAPNRWENIEDEQVLQQQIDSMLRDRGLLDDDLRRAVRAAIVANAERGDHTAEGLARAMGMSQRSLQRKLKARGETIRGMLESHRLTCAQALLLDASLSIWDVTEALGFDSERGFRRAFGRWTGVTPSHWRRAQTASG